MWARVAVTVDLNRYPRLTGKSLCYFIADSLRVEQIRSIRYDDEQIRFTVGVVRSFLRWTSVSTLFGAKVSFRSEPGRLRVISWLSFYDTALFASLLVALLMHYDNRMALLVQADTFFYLYTWFGIMGGTMLFSILRWRGFVQQCVKEAAARVYLNREDVLASKLDAVSCSIEPLDGPVLQNQVGNAGELTGIVSDQGQAQ